MPKKETTVIEMGKLNKNSLIVKSNRLIEASYKLDLQEQRIILLMASMVKRDDKDFQLYRINIKDFSELIGVKNTALYTEIKEITKKIQERVLVITEPDGRELQIGWLSSAEYFKNQGYVELEFSPKLKPYLLEIKTTFTKYQLKNIAGLKSSYSIRIYELLKQYITIGERLFKVEEFKKVLGIKPGSYKNYGDLNRRIIAKAKVELTQKTDISFAVTPKKRGNKVVEILFSIYSTNNPEKTDSEIGDTELKDIVISDIDLYLKLQNFFCLSPIQAKKFLKESEKDPKRIENNLKYVEQEIKAGKVKNVGAYTIKAIQKNWQIQLSLFETQEKEERKKQEDKEKLKRFEAGLETAYKELREKTAKKYKATLPQQEIQEIEERIKKQLTIEMGKNTIGIKTHQDIAIKNYYIKKSGMLDFAGWKKEPIEKYKKQNKIC